MDIRVEHLHRHPQHTEAVARLVHEAFWRDRPGGHTVESLVAHLRHTGDPDRLPLSLVALADGELAGTVNLIDNDDAKRTHLHPWLAAMVVAAPRRGQGIGTRLVRALLAEAARLGFTTVYFGSDGPGFYTRLGAVLHEQVTPEFGILRFALPSPEALPPSD